MLVLEKNIAASTEGGRKPDSLKGVRLGIDPANFQRDYDREPFEFPQNLHKLDLFQPDSLRHLCRTFSSSNRGGYYVARGAPSAGTAFYSVPPNGGLRPDQALERLDTAPLRILLKRPELYDSRFRALLNGLFEQVAGFHGNFGRERVLQLESAVLITSASTITPIHFDPCVGFFAQVEGEKIYHVYSPADTTERELERFYTRGAFEIGAVQLDRRHVAHEHVFRLTQGKGFHQPQNAIHWVETGGGLSVSYTFVYQTDRTRALGRTRAFNHFERRFGLPPAAPGMHPLCDTVKAEAMLPAIVCRKAARRVSHIAKDNVVPIISKKRTLKAS